jgi:hypothetical protein
VSAGRVMAYYGTRNGGSGVRTIEDAAEAEKILKGGYKATEVRLVDESGEEVGWRQRQDDGRWMWCYDLDAFPR